MVPSVTHMTRVCQVPWSVQCVRWASHFGEPDSWATAPASTPKDSGNMNAPQRVHQPPWQVVRRETQDCLRSGPTHLQLIQWWPLRCPRFCTGVTSPQMRRESLHGKRASPSGTTRSADLLAEKPVANSRTLKRSPSAYPNFLEMWCRNQQAVARSSTKESLCVVEPCCPQFARESPLPVSPSPQKRPEILHGTRAQRACSEFARELPLQASSSDRCGKGFTNEHAILESTRKSHRRACSPQMLPNPQWTTFVAQWGDSQTNKSHTVLHVYIPCVLLRSCTTRSLVKWQRSQG